MSNQRFISSCSIDKVKVLLKLEVEQINHFKLLNQFQINITSYKSMQMTACMENWRIAYQEENSVKTNTFYIGFYPNWMGNEPTTRAKSVVIEYNPNKVIPQNILKGFMSLFRQSKRIKFMYMDFAYDMYEIDLATLIVHPRHGNEYTAVIGHGGKAETLYFGTFGECGSVRVYDKAKEQKIKGKAWTRYEIRVKDISFSDEVDLLSKLNYNQIQIKSSMENLSDKDKVILTGLQIDESLLSYMDYRNRKKFKELLQQSLESVELDKQCAVEEFNAYCLEYINIEI